MNKFSRPASQSWLTAAILFAFVALPGCASLGKKKQTPPAEVDSVSSVQIYSVITQNDIGGIAGTASKKKASSGFGFFSGSAKSKVDSPDNDQEVEMIKQVAQNANVPQILSYALNGAFRNGKPVSVGNVFTASKELENLGDYLASVPEAGLLVTTTTYYFTSDYRAVRIETRAALYKREGGGGRSSRKKKLAPIYENTITTQSAEIEAATQKAALRMWLENRGARLVTSLRNSASENAKLLALELNKRSELAPQSKKQSFETVDATSGSAKVSGVIVKQSSDRFVIRMSSGALLSLPKDNNT